MDIIIALIGASTSIIVAILGSLYINISNMKLQNRKLKEEHYVNYIQSLHMLAAHNDDKKTIENYTLHRDKLFIIASEDVIKSILQYEEKAVGKDNDLHDELLTQIIVYIRKDLKIKDKDFPTIYLKKA